MYMCARPTVEHRLQSKSNKEKNANTKVVGVRDPNEIIRLFVGRILSVTQYTCRFLPPRE